MILWGGLLRFVLKKKTVLIVDDTAENIALLSDLLTSKYLLRVAINGNIALKIAAAAKPDLILLDIMMPDLDGYEVCKRLKSNPDTQGIPVIFLTAKVRVEDETRGLEFGAVDFIAKPISPPIVLARIATHLELVQQKNSLQQLVDQQTETLLKQVSQLKAQKHELKTTRLEIVRRLGRAAEFKDNETGTHVIRMSNYAKLLGTAAGFSDEEANLLLNAAPMHDVGKIGVADSILRKPGRLTPEEFEIIKKHTTDGASIIGQHESKLLSTAAIVALTHHEKWDGSGYPHGLKGEGIPLVGRITAIADVFDALSSKRPYKDPWPLEKVINLLRSESGKHFDPDLVRLFIGILPQIEEIMMRYNE